MQNPTGTPVSTHTATPTNLSRRWIEEADALLAKAATVEAVHAGGHLYDRGADALRDVTAAQVLALLAIREELTEIRAGLADVSTLRGDLAGIAEAVRELTGAITAAIQPVDLADVSNSIADVRGEVAEVAAAVRDLAEAIRDQPQPRRRWFSRGTVGA